MRLIRFNVTFVLIVLVSMFLVNVIFASERGKVANKDGDIKADKHPICQMMMKSDKWNKLSGTSQHFINRICGEHKRFKKVAKQPKPVYPVIVPGTIINDPLLDNIADQTTQSQPSIIKDTVNNVILAAYNDDGEFEFETTDSFAGYSISTDNGATWIDMGSLPTLEDNWNVGSVGLAYHEASGRPFFVSIGCNSSGCNFDKLLFGASTDGGNSWSILQNIAPLGVWDKPFIAVDNSGGACDGYIYVVATDFASAPVIKLIRSTDGGGTWQNPVILNAGHENCDTGAFPVVAKSDGTVYVAWEDGGCIQPGNMPGIEIVKSTDCGETWSPITTVTTITPVLDPQASSQCGVQALKGLIRANDFPFVGIHPNDSDLVAIVYNSDPDGDNATGDHSDIYFVRSDDGGSTWITPIKVNDDNTLNDNFMPFLTVSPDARILVGWYDRREDENNLYMRVWVAMSTNGGDNWTTNFPIGSVIFPPAVNFDPAVEDCYMGDYNYATSDSQDWHVVWGDNRRIESNPPHTGPRNDPDVYYGQFPLYGPGGVLVYVSSTIYGGDVDPYPEPGEILSLDVTISNIGSASVNSIMSYLDSSTDGITIMQTESTYPDLDVGQSAINDTKFQFKISPDFTCGDKIDFILYVISSEGLDQLHFSLRTGYIGPEEEVFAEDFESGLGDWVAYDMCAGNLMWHLTTECESLLTGHSLPTSAFYGIDAFCDYDTEEWECGALESPSIDLSNYYGALLDFNYFLFTESFCDWDLATAQVSVDGGLSWTTVAGNCEVGNLSDPSNDWEAIEDLELPGSDGAENVKIRFTFDTIDELYNSYPGFYVDDVVIKAYESLCTIDPFAVQPYTRAHINDANGNGIIEPDELIQLQGHMANIGVSIAPNVIGQLSTNDPINIPDTEATYGDINAGENKVCTDCYDNVVVPHENRPDTHWDVELTESVQAYGYGPYDYNYQYHVGNSFTDVPPSHMFYAYIETVLHSGVTSGCTATQYCPSNNVLRNQMAKSICTAMENAYHGSCSITNCQEIFSDVPATNPFCPFIEALYNAGIVSGCGTNPLRYCPTNTTTRQAMAKFICLGMDEANQAECTVNPCAGIFQDIPATNPFCSYIETLYNAGIISGCSTNPLLYCPNDNVKRGQMAKFIVNAFNFSL